MKAGWSIDSKYYTQTSPSAPSLEGAHRVARHPSSHQREAFGVSLPAKRQHDGSPGPTVIFGDLHTLCFLLISPVTVRILICNISIRMQLMDPTK